MSKASAQRHQISHRCRRRGCKTVVTLYDAPSCSSSVEYCHSIGLAARIERDPELVVHNPPTRSLVSTTLNIDYSNYSKVICVVLCHVFRSPFLSLRNPTSGHGCEAIKKLSAGTWEFFRVPLYVERATDPHLQLHLSADPRDGLDDCTMMFLVYKLGSLRNCLMKCRTYNPQSLLLGCCCGT